MNKVDIDRHVEFDKEYVVVKIPVQDLIDNQAERLDLSFEVTNKDKMVDALIEYLEGLNLDESLDLFFETRYNEGDAWLKGNWSSNPVFPK